MVKTVYPVSKETEKELEELGVVSVGGSRITAEKYESVIREDLKQLRRRLGYKPGGSK